MKIPVRTAVSGSVFCRFVHTNCKRIRILVNGTGGINEIYFSKSPSPFAMCEQNLVLLMSFFHNLPKLKDLFQNELKSLVH